MEIGQDWGTLLDELGRLIRDGKDVLDATMFWTGSGTDQPSGVLDGLTASQKVETSAATSFAADDVWLLKQALPARFIANATFVAHPTTWDTTHRFVGGGATDDQPVLATREGRAAGLPKVELSTVVTTTGGSKIMAVGDFRTGFVIIDRIGMSVELIPHLFGGNQRPTGQRGLVGVGRTGSAVVVPNAFRYLEVKA